MVPRQRLSLRRLRLVRGLLLLVRGDLDTGVRGILGVRPIGGRPNRRAEDAGLQRQFWSVMFQL